MGTLPAVLSKSITISRGDGIPPNLAQNLDIFRRVGILPAVFSKSITISRGNGIPPNLARNLDMLRRVGTLTTVKQPSRKIKSLRTHRRKL